MVERRRSGCAIDEFAFSMHESELNGPRTVVRMRHGYLLFLGDVAGMGRNLLPILMGMDALDV